MQRAGLAIARHALAIAPHAHTIWIACGPGNNGGDGMETAVHLQRWGKTPIVTCLPSDKPLPSDATAARDKALESGVLFAPEPPAEFDLCIDALFGIGAHRAFSTQCAAWIALMNQHTAPVLAVDLPSGLHADSGKATRPFVKAHHTLSLLTLKPGLFTSDGREACGQIWLNTLKVEPHEDPCAELITSAIQTPRPHNSHKGSYGDVAVIGGGTGMPGAALLAARAALHCGAGRVYVGMLDSAGIQSDLTQPELMFRTPLQILDGAAVIVAGCGGSAEIAQHLPALLRRPQPLVLDADALNIIASSPELIQLLHTRQAGSTVITPHPLEAARLLQVSVSDIQAQRLHFAQTMAAQWQLVVVLKGSGTVVAAPGTQPRINTSGNAKLATAGTGDVLAGMIGAELAKGGSGKSLVDTTLQATCNAVFRHGQLADQWAGHQAMTAMDLVHTM